MQIYKYDLVGNYIATYETFTDAAKESGLKSVHRIRMAAKEEKGQSGEFQWRFYKNDKIDAYEEFKRTLSVSPGDVFPSNNYGDFKVLEKVKSDKHRNTYFRVKFIKTGGENISTIGGIKTGQVKDYLTPTFYGIGFLGNDYPRGTKEIGIWNGMLSRCYNKNDAAYGSYGGKGVSVEENWHDFSKFYNELRLVDGWDEGKFLKNEIVLDKDLKQQTVPFENKVYSRNTCVFITPSENSKLANKSRIVSFSALSPEGVYYPKESNIEEFFKEKGIKNPEHAYPLISGKAYSKTNSNKTVSGWAFGKENTSKEKLASIQNIKEKQKVSFIATSPKGISYERKGIGVFVREFDLKESDRQHISACLKGNRKTVKGWTFKKISQEV